MLFNAICALGMLTKVRFEEKVTFVLARLRWICRSEEMTERSDKHADDFILEEE